MPNAETNEFGICHWPFGICLSLLDRFFLAGSGFGEDLALIDAVERRAQLGAGARADDVPADLLQERELLRRRVEGDEIHLHGPLAPGPNLARDVLGVAAVGVLAVGNDEQVLAEDAGAIEIGARLTHRLADRGAAARAREVRQHALDRVAVVRL